MNLTTNEWKDVCNDIKNAKALMEKPVDDFSQSVHAEMAEYRRFIRGLFDVKEMGIDSKSLIHDNDFYVNLNILRPNLYFERPGVTVTAVEDTIEADSYDPVKNVQGKKKYKAEDAAKLIESVMNWYGSPKRLDDQEIFKRCVDDALICHFSAHWSAWQDDEDTVDLTGSWEDKQESFKEKKARIDQERLMALKQTNGDQIAGEQMAPVSSEAAQTMVPQIKSGTLISSRISPFDCFPDPECTDVKLKTARFVARRLLWSTKYVNKIFGLKLHGSSLALFADNADYKDKRNDLVSLMRNEVMLYMDMENRRWVYWVDELKDRPALIIEWPWEAMKGYPVNILAFSVDNDRFTPIPDFRHYKRLVLKKMQLHSKLAELLQRINKTFLSDERISGKLDEILNGPVGGVVPIKRNSGEKLEDFIKEVADFSISPSSIQYLDILDQTVERVTGISDYRRGVVKQAKKTAFEIQQVASEQNLKVEERKGTLSSFIVSVYEKRLQLLQENATVPQIIKITKDKKNLWIPWTKDDIQGEYEFDLDVDSMLKKNKEVLWKLSMEKHERLSADPFETPEGRMMLLKDIHEAAGDKEIDKRIGMPPPPPPTPQEKPHLSMSLKLDVTDLMNPMVLQLLKSEGVNLQPVQVPVPAGGQPGVPPVVAPTAGQQAVNLQTGEMKV